MRIITESDLMKIVKRVLNEQEIKQFDEDEIDLIHLIFERELKPPFRKGGKNKYGNYHYLNRDGKIIGWVYSNYDFIMSYKPCLTNVKDKVCQIFEFPYDNRRWWAAIKPHLKSWMENQLNMEFNALGAHI